jgi:hypothetical protein
MKTFHQWLEVIATPPGGPIPGGMPMNIAAAQQQKQREAPEIKNPDLQAAKDQVKKKTAAQADIDIRKAVNDTKGTLSPTNPDDAAKMAQLNTSAGQALTDIAKIAAGK